jgi:hypothetical protein
MEKSELLKYPNVNEDSKQLKKYAAARTIAKN